MDWLRRNWPDLLIGVALVAVIAGIIATLISGGSFFPVGQGERGGTTPTQSGPVTPPSQSAPVDVTPLPSDTSGAGATAAQGGATGTTDANQGADQGATTPGTDAEPGIAALPPTGSDAGAGAGAGAGTEAPAQASDEPAQEPAAAGGVTPLAPPGATTAPAATAPTTPATTPAASTPSAPAAASAGAEEASYRVAVGAFGNADNAQRLAQQFQAAGYPVLLGTQGNLTIVLVGPYASEAEARRVADQVRAADFGVVDPVVHLFEPDGSGSTASAPAAPSAASSPAASSAATGQAAAAAPSASGRYLQVGAYANRESSLPQRERLEGLGFEVTEVQEGTLVKLLVGPYQGGALSDAQGRLAAEGIENFARGL